jgi:hypothetical protein
LEVVTLHLDKIIERIDRAFGEAPAFPDHPVAGQDIEALGRVFGDDGFQGYLQDQVNRQIIRDYLTNAVLLGFLCEEGLVALMEKVASSEGRAAMSLHMLMSSVESASELLSNGGAQLLQSLVPVPGSTPHMKLVPS